MSLKLSEIINNPNAVADLFCKPLNSHRNESPLDEQSSEVMITLMLSKGIEAMYADMSKKMWCLPAIEKRQQVIFNNNLLDKETFIFLAFNTEGNIGTMVMYLTFIQWFCFGKYDNEKDFFSNVFCTHIFPMGVFKKETLHKLWDATKVYNDYPHGDENRKLYETDNLVDYAQCLKSFIKQPEPDI